MKSINRRELTCGLAASTLLPLGGARAAEPPAAATWEKLPTAPYKGKQDDIYFIDGDHGWYGNGAGRVYGTSDGGRTWSLLWEQTGTYVRALGFVDANIGILGNIGTNYFPGVTDANPLYRTEDGGRTWRVVERIEGPKPIGVCAIDILRRPFVNAGVLDQRLTIRAGGRVGGPAHLMTSRDLGVSWTCEDLSAVTGAILDVHFINERVGFIAGASDSDVETSNAVILRTLDGGKTWRRIYRGARPFEIIWKLSFPTPRAGFATVQNYNPDTKESQRRVARTTDGGATWEELPLADDHALQEFGIGFIDEHRGWVGGSPHGYETRDGGRHWLPADMGRATNKIRVVPTATGRRVFAIGVDVRRLDLPR
ncbi:MAG: hypothetical protein ABIS14_00730 [Sphingomonas sp.]